MTLQNSKNVQQTSSISCSSHCSVCGIQGHLIAAIHNKEFKVIENHGKFSGSGIGLTTSGAAGFGFSSGTYEKHETSATKRAIIFAEPEAPKLMSQNISLSALTGMCITLSLIALPYKLYGFLGLNGSDNSLNPMIKFFDGFSEIQSYILLPVLLVGLISFFFDLAKDNRSEEKNINAENKLRKNRYNKKLAFYYAMRYCENCHLLYDNKRNKRQPANNQGFQVMLSSS